jgi:ATP-dependent RNA helicase RhlE
MRSPVKIQVGPPSHPVERAEQKLFHVQETEKISLLLSLLQGEQGRVLVFVRTKRGVDRLASRILRRHHGVARIHGDREQKQRDEAMAGFREGRYRILIATDIAARGLDIADIEHVINYDFPRSPEDYVHRIGRTARLAAAGKATSFVTPADRHYLADLERLLGSRVPVVPAPGGRSSAAEESPPRTHAAHTHRQHTGRTPVAASHAAHAPHPHEAGGTADAHGHGGRRGRRRGQGRGQGRGAAQTVAPASSAPAPEASVMAAAPHPHQTGTAPGSERSGRRRNRRRGRGPESAAPLSPVPASEAFAPAAPDAGVHRHSPHPRPEVEPDAALLDEFPSAVVPTTVEWD